MAQSPTPQTFSRQVAWNLSRLFILLLSIGWLSILAASNAAAQDSLASDAAAKLDSDIESIKPAALLPIYLTRPYQKIADLPAASSKVLVAQGKKWSTVQFTEPTVPGWVSEDYVRLEGEVGTVLADILNVRLRPNPQSRVMSQVKNGYQSEITAQYAGFFQILLPADFIVAIRHDESSVASKAAEPSSQVNSAPQSPPSMASGELLPKPIQAQERSQNPSSESAFDAGLHRIAPGDAISLMVFGEPDLSIQNVRVPQSGQVSFPLVGPVTVAGKTTAVIESEMEKLLEQGYVKNPRLSVTIFSYRPIFIRGGVNSTGAFPYTEGLSVAKAIALAGGSKTSAMQNGVSILRDGNTVAQELPIDSTFEVASGDVISVAEGLGQEASGSFIYIHGEVQQPGEYIYRRGLTVEKAIVLASGFSLRASKRKISITRYAGKNENEPPIEMKRVEMFTPVEPGDVINVGASWF